MFFTLVVMYLRGYLIKVAWEAFEDQPTDLPSLNCNRIDRSLQTLL